MAKTAGRRPAAAAAAPPKRKAFRPLLLAVGLGLLWFVQFQQGGGSDDGPAWSYGLVLGTRLLADFVGAWLVIAAARLVAALLRAGLAQYRAAAERESL